VIAQNDIGAPDPRIAKFGQPAPTDPLGDRPPGPQLTAYGTGSL